MSRNRDSLLGSANRPVIWVNWYDAHAFCAWLTLRWQDKLPMGWRVALPSEAEWEKAARGGEYILKVPTTTTLAQGFAIQPHEKIIENPVPKRAFPWGDDASTEHANVEGNVGNTSTSGCFHQGSSPYGCEDMAGNVWEWTRSKYHRYPYQAHDGREDDSGDDSRVVRGGSWADTLVNARCAVRFRLHPVSHILVNLGFRVVVVAAPVP